MREFRSYSEQAELEIGISTADSQLINTNEATPIFVRLKSPKTPALRYFYNYLHTQFE